MRTLGASRKRWDVCFSDEKLGLDLREAVRDLEDEPRPCQDGLRSVCWKVGRQDRQRQDRQRLMRHTHTQPGFPPLWTP